MPRSARRASELSCTLLPSWLSRICSIWTQALRLSCIGLLLNVVGLSPLIDLRLGLDQSVVSVERDTFACPYPIFEAYTLITRGMQRSLWTHTHTNRHPRLPAETGERDMLQRSRHTSHLGLCEQRRPRRIDLLRHLPCTRYSRRPFGHNTSPRKSVCTRQKRPWTLAVHLPFTQ